MLVGVRGGGTCVGDSQSPLWTLPGAWLWPGLGVWNALDPTPSGKKSVRSVLALLVESQNEEPQAWKGTGALSGPRKGVKDASFA